MKQNSSLKKVIQINFQVKNAQPRTNGTLCYIVIQKKACKFTEPFLISYKNFNNHTKVSFKGIFKNKKSSDSYLVY